MFRSSTKMTRFTKMAMLPEKNPPYSAHTSGKLRRTDSASFWHINVDICLTAKTSTVPVSQNKWHLWHWCPCSMFMLMSLIMMIMMIDFNFFTKKQHWIRILYKFAQTSFLAKKDFNDDVISGVSQSLLMIPCFNLFEIQNHNGIIPWMYNSLVFCLHPTKHSSVCC